MRRLFTCICILLCSCISAQDLNSQVKKDSLAGIYFRERKLTLPIYNGRQFPGYSHLIEGFPYYLSNEWQKGSIKFEGTWYHDFPMMYDTYTDQVVGQSENGFPFIIIGDRVSEFTIGGHEFVRLGAMGTTGAGFYQRLVKGSVNVYAKRVKLLDEKIDGLTIERKFKPSDTYYIEKAGRFYAIDRQKDLFDALKDKKPALQDELRRSDLRFKHNPEMVIVRLASYYNQLPR